MSMEEGWKRFGLLKVPGLPAPTGQYNVGCVDLMHKLEGDDDGLLVRLFYPTNPQLREGAGYQYAKWTPHKRYLKGSVSWSRSRFPGLISSITNLILDPRIPAFEGAPLYQDNTKQATESPGSSDDTSSSPDTKTQAGATAEDSREKTVTSQEPQSDQSAEEPVTTAPPSVTSKPFPVVVFSHGLSVMRTVCSGICSDLASHGYVVAAVEHRDRSCAITLKRVPKPGGTEGELMDEWVEYERPESERDADFDPKNLQDVPLRHKQVKQRSFDVKQTLNLLHLLNDGGSIQNMLDHSREYDFGQFKGRLDVEKAAILGHSFGGGTTVLALRDEPRFRCGIAMDGWMVPFPEDFLEGLSVTQPLLFINSSIWQWKYNIQGMFKLIRSSEARGNNCCSIITLRDADHFSQTDVKFTMPPFAVRGISKAIGGLGTMDPLLAHQVNLQLCHGFLKRHLLNDPAYQQNIPDLDGGEGCSEYIIHGTNVDLSSPVDGNTAVTEQAGADSSVDD